MTKTLRKIGGILAIVGGIISSFAWAIILSYMIEKNSWSYWQLSTRLFTTLAMIILSIIGGILAIKDISIGCIFALIAGIIMLIGSIFNLGDVYGGTWSYTDVSLTVHFIVDPILMAVGGVLGLAVGSES